MPDGRESRAATRRRPPVVRRLAAVASLAAGLLLTSCGAFGGGDALTVYSGQHVQTTQALAAAFQKATGITVDVRSGDEDTLADQIVTEGSHSPADVLYTENSPPLQYLGNKGLLSPVQPATLSAVPRRYSSPEGNWVAVSARVSTMVYDPRLIGHGDLPSSVLQMADPRYRGRVGLAPSESDFQPVVTSVARAQGRAAALRWLEGLKANAGPHLYSSNEALNAAVNNGQVAFGLINQYYWYRMRAELGPSKVTSRLATFASRDPGYVLDVSGAAVLRSSHLQAQAQRFVSFLVSRAGQEVIAHSFSFEYPLLPGVAPPAGEPSLASLRPNPIGFAALGDGSEAVALLRQAGLL